MSSFKQRHRSFALWALFWGYMLTAFAICVRSHSGHNDKVCHFFCSAVNCWGKTIAVFEMAYCSYSFGSMLLYDLFWFVCMHMRPGWLTVMIAVLCSIEKTLQEYSAMLSTWPYIFKVMNELKVISAANFSIFVLTHYGNGLARVQTFLLELSID